MAAIEAQLRRQDDVKVLCGHWAWSEEQPYPKLEQVLKAPLWRLDDYQALRWRLTQPAIDPTVTVGGTFATVELTPAGAAPSQVVPLDTADSSTTQTAEGKPASLVHVFAIGQATPVPKEMVELSLAVLFFEVERQFDAIPPWVRRAIATNVPVVLVGAEWLVQDFVAAVENSFKSERMHRYPIRLHSPSTGIGEDYAFSEDAILVLRRVPLSRNNQVQPPFPSLVVCALS